MSPLLPGPGTRLGPYEIIAPLGSGGMGEVYRARHLKLHRDVAIKLLPPAVADDPWRRSRFEREARTASALNHPNIVTIYDIAEHAGTSYIAMELVEGSTLRDLLAAGPVPLERAVGWVRQIAEGLARAHAAGIVHRDIKPANVMVNSDGLVKILDFGLAKPLVSPRGKEQAPGPTTETAEGIIVGTPHYMSPEQCSGDELDHRSDQFALGVILYQLIVGKLPFDGPSARAVMTAILFDAPAPLRRLRTEVPAEVERIVSRCLEKDLLKRFETTAEVAEALRLARAPSAETLGPGLARWQRPPIVAALVLLVLALGAGGWLWARRAAGPAPQELMDRIARLTEKGELFDAYAAARQLERRRPGDPAVTRMLERMTLPIPVNTEPAGATVEVKGYSQPDAPWERVGVTPLVQRVPYAMMRWRISKAGFEPFEGAPFSGPAFGALAMGLHLDSLGSLPAGMVRIPGGVLPALPGGRSPGELPAVELQSFFLDRYEVTNNQYRSFVDAGGYTRPEWWPPIVREGKAVPFQVAAAAFVDPTGRPGPSTWEAGGYPPGEADYPVSGISWYEAAAYCASQSKSLPTIYHWFQALGQDQLSDILLYSNMDGTGKAPVSRFRGLSAYGTYDMAGNVKEWAWNAAGRERYLLGGAWNEPTYLFKHLIAADPVGRDPNRGVRCARYPDSIDVELTAPVTPHREFELPPLFTDEQYRVVRGMYAYDQSPLDARLERVNDSLPAYRRETVSFRTAYGEGRMEINLLFPREGPGPYQAVIWFPGDDVFLLQSSQSFASTYLFDFIPRAGRVLVYPIYKGMYERFEPPEYTPSALRDRLIRWTQDLSRTIDYLETRPDIDARKIAYYGFSAGAAYGPVFNAVEPRFAASILAGGGLIPLAFRPESHPAAFAPRDFTPTLMINGRDDFLLSYEFSQLPFFKLLGAPPDRKRHARLDGGHIPTNRLDIVREVLDWLDQQMGPIRRTD